MTPINNIYTQYQMTPDEQLAGSFLNQEQKAMLQNDMATYAIQKSALKFDPNNPMDFVQKEADLQGRILALTILINRSDAIDISGISDANPNSDQNS